jgi:secreted PhoX family phosphatase
MSEKEQRSSLSRRQFLHRAAIMTGGTLASMTALGRLSARVARAARGDSLRGPGYGPLAPVSPVNDLATLGFPELAGFPILALPRGFSYVAFSLIGGVLSDGHPVPMAHDGMAAFAHPTERRLVRLIRNHEDRAAPAAGSVLGPAATRYDANGRGGTVTLDYCEARRMLVRDFISLNGTIVNCAGGIGLGRRSWLTCEETTANAGSGPAPFWAQHHGYVFEVPLALPPNTTAPAIPLPAMGRFSHEAVAVDQHTGIVYLTEDPGSGTGAGFYRFLPHDPACLRAGGELQMLGVARRPQVDLRQGQRVGQWLPVEWLGIAEPDPAAASNSGPERVFTQGFAQGGAMFNRLEGCWAEGGRIFFVSTSGGDAKNGDVNSDGFAEGYGQIWEYRTTCVGGGALRLVFESPGQAVLDSPDNITVTPRGGLLLCEDDAGSADGDTHPLAPGIVDVNRLIGIAPRGEAFEFAVNRLNDTELAGACFSPSGRTLFANIYGNGTRGSGMTVAITGPWGNGPL